MRFTITETRQSEAHKRSHNTARATQRKANPPSERYKGVPTEFIAIDGEGISLWEGCYARHSDLSYVHRYVLLGVGDQQITNKNGLEWDEILEFLWDEFLDHGTKSVAYVGFVLGYDFWQWIKKLPEDRARMLLTDAGKAKRKPKSAKRPMPFPVRYGEWEFDMLGTKRFKLRKIGSKRWMNICDSGPFFQKSFLNVINPENWSEPVVSQEEYNQIEAGKSRRSTALLDSDMLHYNARENEILARVLQRLNEGFQSLDIHLRPGQWFGPGQAAQAWLEGKAITRDRLHEVTPHEVLEHARESYFGGWFEIMAHGYVPGITYEYDINSAYPYIISQLPCLEHGEWVHRDPDTQWESPLTLVYARVKGDNPYIGAMLHRDKKGNIYRPHETEGWYWLHEITAAKKAGLIGPDPDILDWWSYHKCDHAPPFREVRAIYNKRREVGSKTPLGIACKLVPNSLYGKFAQSIGEPKFANPIYASLITAGCRTMILDAIATHPFGTEAVRMVATDGVYFDSPHPTLPCGKDKPLGDWEMEEKKNITLFKPGVYWDDKARAAIKNGKAPVFKARGVNGRDLAKKIEKIDFLFRADDILGRGIRWPGVKFPVSFAMISAPQALQRGDWSLAGTVIPDATAKQGANPETKRCDPYIDGNIIRTKPRKNDPYEPSHPYEKRFGMEDPFSDLRAEEPGITPDGLVGNIVREALGI
jgi:hypothetical protein